MGLNSKILFFLTSSCSLPVSYTHLDVYKRQLLDRGVKVDILNMGRLDNTPASKLVRQIFFAFAEFERDMIVERTQEGKAIAKTKEGYKEGRDVYKRQL